MITVKHTDSTLHTKLLQNALDAGGEIIVEAGVYTVDKTLRIKSNTTLYAEGATIRLADNCMHTEKDFLLSNTDLEKGNESITIIGGTWDGNCRNNMRGELLAVGYTGTLLNFKYVKNLTLKKMTLKNPECYYIRLCFVEDFLIEDIRFNSTCLRPNQDGVHIGGGCKNGVIANLKGSYGSPNDDFVAFNADDCLERLQNIDMLNAPISQIKVRNVESPLCHTFIRLLSVNSKISDVTIENVSGGCRLCAVNADGGRYCNKKARVLTPDMPNYFCGSGMLENVRISDVNVSSKRCGRGVIVLETGTRNLSLERFSIRKKFFATPLFYLNHCSQTELSYTRGGRKLRLKVRVGAKKTISGKGFSSLTVNKE